MANADDSAWADRWKRELIRINEQHRLLRSESPTAARPHSTGIDSAGRARDAKRLRVMLASVVAFVEGGLEATGMSKQAIEDIELLKGAHALLDDTRTYEGDKD